jgi:hypothetical protein
MGCIKWKQKYMTNDQTENLLIIIANKVAMQAYRRIGGICQRSSDDIRQDLIVEAFQDKIFLKKLRACQSEEQASKVAYGFADKTRKRLCRTYQKTWPRLKQVIIFASV